MKREMKSVLRSGLFFIAYLGVSVSTVNWSFASSVALQWDANTEADLAGYKVYYKANSAVLPFDGAGAIEGLAPIDVAKETTATITGLDPATDYYFAVTAYNTSGMESTYSDIVQIAKVQDVTAPTVSLTSPVAGATLKGVVTVAATASDDLALSKVELYGSGALVAAGNTSPLTYTLDTTSLPNGNYTVVAKAFDTSGNVATSSVDVTVLNDAIAPTVALTNPSSGTTVTGTVNVTANVTDNTGVSSVEFYVNGSLQSVSSSAPYIFSWNTTAVANGAYTLTLRAYDGSGNVGQSSSVAVNVLNDSIAPTVTFLAPTSSYVYTSTVNVSASATDNVAITRMELYVDGLFKYTTSSDAFSLGWTFSLGQHIILVKAYDAANNVKSVSRTINRFF